MGGIGLGSLIGTVRVRVRARARVGKKINAGDPPHPLLHLADRVGWWGCRVG